MLHSGMAFLSCAWSAELHFSKSIDSVFSAGSFLSAEIQAGVIPVPLMFRTQSFLRAVIDTILLSVIWLFWLISSSSKFDIVAITFMSLSTNWQFSKPRHVTSWLLAMLFSALEREIVPATDSQFNCGNILRSAKVGPVMRVRFINRLFRL